MRARTSLRALALATLVTAALSSPVGSASATGGGSVGSRLSSARQQQAMAIAAVKAIRSKLPGLEARLAQLEKQAGEATIAALNALRAEQSAQQALADARNVLDTRARTAFEFGAAATLDAMLGAKSFSDLSAMNEYATRTLTADSTSIDAVQAARQGLARARASAETDQRAATRREQALSSTISDLQSQLDAAVARAKEAGIRVHDLAQQLARIRAARAQQQARQQNLSGAVLGTGSGISIDPTWFDGRNQDQLLALLGPDGGRTCTIPSGLKDTGQQISGDASWYGWDFAGQSTASGATFDPRLMTAANRTLPFGTFLRVRWQNNCVIVLVNDRGPYGNYDRVIDLSLAAARALGSESAGVVRVTADVLIPR